jgi:hypothetical protein
VINLMTSGRTGGMRRLCSAATHWEVRDLLLASDRAVPRSDVEAERVRETRPAARITPPNMSHSEKFVTGLAAAVLLAGFAADGLSKPMRTSHHGSRVMPNVAHSTPHGMIGRPHALHWVNDATNLTGGIQITCREDDRSSCGAIKNLVFTKVFKCTSDGLCGAGSGEG